MESPAFDARRDARRDVSGAEQDPIAYAEACGSNVVDVDGNRYVDLVAGFGALVLGHRPADVERAVFAQSARLGLALGDVYASDVKVALCERLAGFYPEPGARVMLGMSGADAVTAALKTAMMATGKPGVVAFHGAYHGLSYGPLAACGFSESFRKPFEEQLGGYVQFVDYPSAAAGVAPLAQMENVGAILVEPLLGRGGCVVPPAGFLRALRELCDARGALLIADEIWTGMGRSGSWLASLDEGVVPDVLCIGKGLGGGHPISACIGSARAMEAWGRNGGSAIHTATHFAAPPACAAALATIEALERGGLVTRAREIGERFQGELRARTAGCGVREVRGRGLMVGVELASGASRALAVARALLARGYLVLTGGVRGDVLTLTPALDIDEALLTGFAEALGSSLRELPS